MTSSGPESFSLASASQAEMFAALRREREAARALAEALDHAIERGLWEQAERLAESAARLAVHHSPLAERLARLRLGTGENETALMILDALPAPTASQRLLRAIALLRLGRRFEAHADLRQWASKAAAPLAARSVLAILEWESGDLEAAAAALMRNLRQIEDPESIIALLLVSVASNNAEQAGVWAERLRTLILCGGAGHDAELVLRALGLPGVDARLEPPPKRVMELADELLQNEAVIPALTAAQRILCRRPSTRLLRRAIELALDQLDDQAAAYEALAQLSLALGERETASEWACRGAASCPLSASLARMVQDLATEAVEREAALPVTATGPGQDRSSAGWLERAA